MYVGFGKKKQILKIVAHVRQRFFHNFITKFPVQVHNYIRNTGLKGMFDIQFFSNIFPQKTERNLANMKPELKKP